MLTAARASGRIALLVAAATVGMAMPLRGQHDVHEAHGAVDVAMSGAVKASAHLRLSPARTATAADSARLARVERALLGYLRRYEDVRAAEADGYEMFLPQVKAQAVYHFTHRGHAIRAAFGFDPVRPTSLLYRRGAGGRLVLAGAMYTAPAGHDADRLDARIPLGLARWHQHVDICVPGHGESARWREVEGGRMRFGPAGAIATREACEAAGGRFHERIFGWMVHANLVRTPDGARIVWHEEHGH